MDQLRRKSTMFLNNISPAKNTYTELIQEKFEVGKFPITITGITQIVGMLILIGGLTVFIAEPSCEGSASWYPYILPSCLGVTIFVQFVLYLIFSLGYTTKGPWKWIKADIYIMFTLSVLTIVISLVTNFNCEKPSSINKIPGPMGVAGGCVLIVSCAGIFLMYRFTGDNEEEEQYDPRQRQQQRKSVFA